MSHLRIPMSFIFDSKDTWANDDDFARDLADFFKSKGMEAEIIRNPLEDDSPGQIEVFVTKKTSALPFLDRMLRKGKLGD